MLLQVVMEAMACMGEVRIMGAGACMGHHIGEDLGLQALSPSMLKKILAKLFNQSRALFEPSPRFEF